MGTEPTSEAPEAIEYIDFPYWFRVQLQGICNVRHSLLGSSPAEMLIAESRTSVRMAKLPLCYFDRVTGVHDERGDRVPERMEPAPRDSKRVENRPNRAARRPRWSGNRISRRSRNAGIVS